MAKILSYFFLGLRHSDVASDRQHGIVRAVIALEPPLYVREGCRIKLLKRTNDRMGIRVSGGNVRAGRSSL